MIKTQKDTKSHLRTLIGEFLAKYIDKLSEEDKKRYDGMQVDFKCKIRIK